MVSCDVSGRTVLSVGDWGGGSVWLVIGVSAYWVVGASTRFRGARWKERPERDGVLRTDRDRSVLPKRLRHSQRGNTPRYVPGNAPLAMGLYITSPASLDHDRNCQGHPSTGRSCRSPIQLTDPCNALLRTAAPVPPLCTPPPATKGPRFRLPAARHRLTP